MLTLKYIVEDSTIAQILGKQNFVSDESAMLELVKNAYDAGAKSILLLFEENKITITDDGIGMSAKDIRDNWMHIGKSIKGYEEKFNGETRVLSGSKGIGRFALARLASEIELITKKKECTGVNWTTNWEKSQIKEVPDVCVNGTKIILTNLEDQWNGKKILKLISFLARVYSDDLMKIKVEGFGISKMVSNIFPDVELGENCKSVIRLQYSQKNTTLSVDIESQEFSKKAAVLCKDIDINYHNINIDVEDEFTSADNDHIERHDLVEKLSEIGDFTAEFYFNVSSTMHEKEKFLYQIVKTMHQIDTGIVLYRNAFSIANYQGEKDWLELGKRSRKSPAAATHPTGAWRVRENQINGKVCIDKEENLRLCDLSNRQGIEENIYYELFVKIILIGIAEFERYRQNIIRNIDKKNKNVRITDDNILSKSVMKNSEKLIQLSKMQREQLANEVKEIYKENSEYKKVQLSTENRYKYDIRILNVLATIGLKASSIAHEIRNDKNTISENVTYIIEALKEFEMWEDICSEENTRYAYQNVPELLESNKDVNTKMVSFMDAILYDIKKKQFKSTIKNINNVIYKIVDSWMKEYSWIKINITIQKKIEYKISDDIIKVILDNLILNSIQNNENMNSLEISLELELLDEMLYFKYSDNGGGLSDKYKNNPMRILEVHETTRSDGHGLGMWIVNNTIQMSGGEIDRIYSSNGYTMEFNIGGKV